MTLFDNTESKYIDKKIENAVEFPRLGKIVEVYEHTETNDYSNFEADVILRDEDLEFDRVPIATEYSGLIGVPDPDNSPLCLLTFLDGNGDNPIIIKMLYTNTNRAPIGESGVFRLKQGDLYFEAAADESHMRISHKNTELDEPDAVVEVTESGTINIRGDTVSIDDDDGNSISADSGGVTINADTISIDNDSGNSISTDSSGVTVDADTVSLTDNNGNSISADSGGVTINADTISLGGGSGNSVARKGDSVSVDLDTGNGQITSGSNTVSSE